jgi:hypothetical protein
MSSVGVTPQSNDHELEKLREAWKLLNDLLKNLNGNDGFGAASNLSIGASPHSLAVGDFNLDGLHLKRNQVKN